MQTVCPSSTSSGMRRALHSGHAMQLAREAGNITQGSRAAGMQTKVDRIKNFSLAKSSKIETLKFSNFCEVVKKHKSLKLFYSYLPLFLSNGFSRFWNSKLTRMRRVQHSGHLLQLAREASNEIKASAAPRIQNRAGVRVRSRRTKMSTNRKVIT